MLSAAELIQRYGLMPQQRAPQASSLLSVISRSELCYCSHCEKNTALVSKRREIFLVFFVAIQT
ncbi:MAG: hypothetical protein A3I12_03815 [Gammaproteobacteria bacterium RIFCSPLOWO2_02_FULL_38_11]|nr:MAG: hypothetical protein A3B69_05565 [Gammaproteobacteria bacterium RIFCSPHIGHO2_02_FULL_38_33]OGT23950.1 MAG: hypothetical protein A2W47_01855 [Gammaproteobacteria bacterium RIFCSPHIGHO2_12_38_15]OGT67771.1 MAG: hypothetical protein A3I12_03815 [Gammaproteobacteria bacterium RIFCSPLOWO2_02_FULL_38_11]OGT76710.1 MAG: hypothetical protein A3G71_00070 [Gammaproteobacteria bacterium RIFCSPLOWO2_12_FULL_38_14]